MALCREQEDRVRLLEKINEKLTYLQWVVAQSAGEQDINTIYNIITNGFEQICGVQKCVFFLFEDGKYRPFIVKNRQPDTNPLTCDAIMKALDRARRERVLHVMDLHGEGYCGNGCNKCDLKVLQLCSLYNSKGKPFGVLCAYGANDIDYDNRWQMVLEFYSMQTGLVLENALLNHKLRGLSNTDALTGLYNHRYFYERIKKELNGSGFKKKNVALIMLDVDDFKSYNDKFGHPEGDRVLKGIAGLIKGNTGEKAIACRYGGEEFAVILPSAVLDEGVSTANRICRAVENCHDFMRRITVSAGVASTYDANNKQELIKSGDEALYMAKAQGKNRVCVAR